MIEITDELVLYMRKFKTTFGDVVPLRELLQMASTEDVIDAIKKSLEAEQNLLPTLFGYEKLEKHQIC